MIGQPQLLDTFCCQGGTTRGYQLAGFRVIGVDKEPQPRYCGDEFVQADALQFIADHWREFDAIHASPTCQTRARVTAWRGSRDNHPDTLTPTLELLKTLPLPWVVENVPEAVADGTMRADFLLCGTMFGLPIRRHRAFEVSWPRVPTHIPVPAPVDRPRVRTQGRAGLRRRDGLRLDECTRWPAGDSTGLHGVHRRAVGGAPSGACRMNPPCSAAPVVREHSGATSHNPTTPGVRNDE